MKSYIELGVSTADSKVKAVCQLLERAQIRTFKEKVLLRVGKWTFTGTPKGSGNKALRLIKDLVITQE